MSNHDFQTHREPTLDAYMAEIQHGLRSSSEVSPAVIYTVSAYVDLAKRILLKHRVRDFQAADVVALASIMEARDRAQRIAASQE